jgi:hypothetical protein
MLAVIIIVRVLCVIALIAPICIILNFRSSIKGIGAGAFSSWLLVFIAERIWNTTNSKHFSFDDGIWLMFMLAWVCVCYAILILVVKKFLHTICYEISQAKLRAGKN